MLEQRKNNHFDSKGDDKCFVLLNLVKIVFKLLTWGKYATA